MVPEQADKVEKTRHRDDDRTRGPGYGCLRSVGWTRRRRRRVGQVFAEGRGRRQVSQRGRRPLVAGRLRELLQQRGRGRVQGGHGPDSRVAAAHVADDGQRDRRGCGHYDHRHGQGAQLKGNPNRFSYCTLHTNNTI